LAVAGQIQVSCHEISVVIVTVPALPSTVMRAPSRSPSIAPRTPRTAGMPYSRATIAAWDSTPPVSVTTPAAMRSSGVQAGSVYGQTRTSPGRTRAKSPGPRTILAAPVALPRLPGVPVSAPVAPSGVPVVPLSPVPAGEVLGAASPVSGGVDAFPPPRPGGRAAATGLDWRIQRSSPARAHS